MKNLLLATFLTLSILPACAEAPPVVLTPTKLYDLIEKEQVARTKLTHVSLRFNQRLSKLEKQIVELNDKLEAYADHFGKATRKPQVNK